MNKRDRLSISISVMALGIILAACNATPPMDVSAPAAVPADKVEAVAASTETLNVPVDKQASFALVRVVSGIKRGTTIAHFPASGVKGVNDSLCNIKGPPNQTLEWGGRGSKELGNWNTDLGEIFFDVLKNNGLNIKGDPSDLFGQREEVQSAEYLIGARITDVKGNICHVHDFWNWDPMFIYSGEMSVKVEWTVFSGLLHKEILKVETSGYAIQKEAKRTVIAAIFQGAFADAADKLTHLAKFQDVALHRVKIEEEAVSDEAIHFNVAELRKKSLEKDINSVLSAVVTVRLGGGHGSGFVISEDGLILTNAHVVADAKKVTIVLNNGLEIEGDVLRRHFKRDVALIKSPVRVPTALPIRLTPPKPLEKVFAIGSPLRVDLQSTVTSGIVSAIRLDERTGLKFIQSDAAISPGNSGGPLLDQNGNVLGLSVATIVGPRADSLHLFIPIDEALDALALKPAPPAS